MAQRPSGTQTEIELHPQKNSCPAKETSRDGRAGEWFRDLTSDKEPITYNPGI